jgi:hypothetical protein
MIDQHRGQRKMPASTKDSLSFPPHCDVAMVPALAHACCGTAKCSIALGLFMVATPNQIALNPLAPWMRPSTGGMR